MLILLVHIHVKPEFLEDFIEATKDNARNSAQEPGIARFDFIQQANDPTRFSLIEVYRNVEATAAHKETAHYARWRDAVNDMQVEPRTRVEYVNLLPDDAGW